MKAAAALLAVGLALTGASAEASSSSTTVAAGWLSYGNGSQLTAFAAAPAYTAAVKRFRVAWEAHLDGAIVAEPLAASVPGKGLVVFAATEQGNVYAVGAGGAVLWHTALGAVVAGGDCGSYGVSSTGVVDLARGLLYVADADGYVHGLRLASGAEAPGWPVQVTRRPLTEYVWGGLAKLGNRLYVPIASYCDAPDAQGVPAEGGLLALDLDAPATPQRRFDPAPGPDNLAGVWGWGGVSVAPGGASLYTGVGNAEPDVADANSDSMVQLTPDLSRVLGSDRPSGATPGADIDLGAAPVLFHPQGCPALLAANDKDGELLIWRQNAVGAGIYARVALADSVDPFVGTPSWSAKTQMLYDGGATALRAGKRLVGTMGLKTVVGKKKCTFAKRWYAPTGKGTQPQPLVAGDLVVSTGGDAGGLYVRRAATGVGVWQFPTSEGTISPPILAGGRVVVGDYGGVLYAFAPAR